jgi:cystathionine beta-lyase
MHLAQTAIETFSEKGDNIILQSPVYGPFYDVIENKERKILDNKLIYNQEKATYTIDFILLEKQMKNPKTKIILLCSPHNPIGRV